MRRLCGWVSPFRQANEARANGFLSVLLYVALDDVELNISRVAVRAVQVFDISRHDSGSDLVLEAIDGRIRYVADGAPAWLREALGPTGSGEQRD